MAQKKETQNKKDQASSEKKKEVTKKTEPNKNKQSQKSNKNNQEKNKTTKESKKSTKQSSTEEKKSNSKKAETQTKQNNEKANNKSNNKKNETKEKSEKKEENSKKEEKTNKVAIEKDTIEKKEKEKETEKEKEESQKKAKAKHAAAEPKEKTKKELRQERLEKSRRAKKRKKIALRIAAGVAAVYVLGVVLFSILCYPNTIVADTDLSFHSPHFMKQALVPNSGEYVFSADGYDFELQIDGELIEYNFDVDQVVNKIIEYKNPLSWPVEIFEVHDFMTDSVVNFNKETASSIALPAIKAHNEKAVAPQNADFVCNNETKTVSIKEEVIGNTLNEEKTLASVLGCIGSGRRVLHLGEEEHVSPTLYANDERIENAIVLANKLLMSVMTLQMSTTTVAKVDYQLLSTWVQLKDGYVAGLNDEMLSAWVAQLAAQCDTVGKSRTYTTPYGKTCTVSGGDAIGWAVDQPGLIDALNKQVSLGVTAVVAVPCSSSLNGYAGPGNRDWGARYIDVDLGQQHARMYNDAGSLVWEADIISGKPSTPTPTGIYTIKTKASPSTLIGSPDPRTGQPSYRTKVQFWMGFVGNMVGFHDATWQSGFGGDRYLTVGSHGCVNLSYSAAQSLYGVCASGDIVVVHF